MNSWPLVKWFTSVKAFLIVTSVTELGAGLALICQPAAAAMFLLGTDFEFPAALVTARICGAGILALGIACWCGRDDSKNDAAQGLVVGMLVYDAMTASILAFAGLRNGLNGEILWPGVILHAVMAIWSIVCLRFGQFAEKGI